MVTCDCRFEFPVSEILQTQIDASCEVLAGPRWTNAFHVLDGSAMHVLHDALDAGFAF